MGVVTGFLLAQPHHAHPHTLPTLTLLAFIVGHRVSFEDNLYAIWIKIVFEL
jgi:hypothetical protein